MVIILCTVPINKLTGVLKMVITNGFVSIPNIHKEHGSLSLFTLTNLFQSLKNYFENNQLKNDSDEYDEYVSDFQNVTFLHESLGIKNGLIFSLHFDNQNDSVGSLFPFLFIITNDKIMVYLGKNFNTNNDAECSVQFALKNHFNYSEQSIQHIIQIIHIIKSHYSHE